MARVDFIFKEDLSRLTQFDFNRLEYYLPELKEVKDKQTWLYENLHSWRENKSVENIIFQKIYAGQCSIRLFNTVNTTKENIILNLESDNLSFNKLYLKQSEEISVIFTLKLSNGNYLIRIRVNKGLKQKTEIEYEDVVYITVIFNVDYDVFEIRADSKITPKIKLFLESKIDGLELKQFNLLEKYKTIENFASAIKGTFHQVNAVPSLDVKEISDNDWRSYTKLFKLLDEFTLTNNASKLIAELPKIHFEDNLRLSQLILAGCSKIGLTAENMDLSRQGIFSMIEENIIEHKGAIKVQFDEKSDPFTIHISVDGGIQFKTSVDEKMISYILSYVVGEDKISEEMNDLNEVCRLREDMESYIANKTIKGIRARHLIQNYKLDENHLKQELDSYTDTGKLLLRYELKCCDEGKKLSHENLENLMLAANMLSCTSCSTVFEGTDDVEKFIELNSNKIDIIYYIVRDNDQVNSAINSFNLFEDNDQVHGTINSFDLFEDSLNSNCETEDFSNSKFKRFLNIFIGK